MAFDSTTIRPPIGDLQEFVDLEDRVAAVEEGITSVVQAALDSKPDAATIDFIVVLTQSEYDAIGVPDGRTLYVVTS